MVRGEWPDGRVEHRKKERARQRATKGLTATLSSEFARGQLGKR